MLKKLGLTALMLFALKGGYAQSVDSSNETLPLIPVFDVKYDPSMSIVNADGEVSWKGRYYKKDGDYIGEIKGVAKIDVSLFLLGIKKVYVGFTTRINYTKNTIETITYNNGSDDDGEKKELNDYEMDIARKESIDTLLANDVSLEFVDYNSGKLVDSEAKKVINSNSYGLQESYFFVRSKTDGKKKFNETFKVHIKGKEYDIPVRDSVNQDGEKFLFVDLQLDDPKNPGEKINILEQIDWLQLYNNHIVPYKVIAKVNTGFIGIKKEIELKLKP